MGGAPSPPQRRPLQSAPPAPLPPPATVDETEAGDILTQSARRMRRRFSRQQSILTGPLVGTTGDRPLGT